MEVDEDEMGLAAEAFDFVEGELEGVFQGGHEGAALGVHDGDGREAGELIYGGTVAGRAGGIVQRAQEAGLVVQEFGDLLLVPEVVAAGDDVDAGGEDLFGGARGDAGAAGGVLAVGHDEVEGVARPQLREQELDGAAAGLADDVSDEQ